MTIVKPSSWVQTLIALVFAFAVSLVIAEAAHAHSEPIISVETHIDGNDAHGAVDEVWIDGHCHGGPSCTGGLYLSDTVRPEGIDRLIRTAFLTRRSNPAGRLPSRDPPIPIE